MDIAESFIFAAQHWDDEDAEKLAKHYAQCTEKLEALVPKLRYEKYVVSVGSNKDRVRVTGPGLKFTVEPSWHSKRGESLISAETIVDGLIEAYPGFQASEDSVGSSSDEEGQELAKRWILRTQGKSIQATLDATPRNTKSAQDAKSRAEERERKAEERRHQKGLDELRSLIREHEFSEEELLQAWKTHQVRAVTES